MVSTIKRKIKNSFSHNKISQKHIHSSVAMRKVVAFDYGKGNEVYIARNSVLSDCKITFYGDNNKVVIGEGCRINGVNIWIEDNNNTVTIGDGATFQGNTTIDCIEGTSITIGKDCMFSSGINLRTSDSHSIVDMNGERINPAKDITLGEHVWIGHNVYICKGVSLQNDSVVGACSVVTKPFNEPNVIIAGNPAKVIKNNTTWKRERI